MTTVRYVALLAVCLQLFIGVFFAAAQALPEEVSGQPVEINGRYFLIHTVARGESLYGISKRYGVSQGEIALHNPDIYYGIKVGQKLRIPTEKPAAGGGPREYTLHLVEEGETLYSLAKHYGKTVEELRSYNGLTSDALAKHSLLRIPTEKPAAGGGPREYTLHLVQEGETLYSLAKHYGKTVEELRSYNGLASDALAKHFQLRIPYDHSGGSGPVTRSGEVLHQVQRGETLHSLARQYGSTIEAIRGLNGLASDALSEGMELRIPKAGGGEDTCVMHRVQRGESLYSIARRYGVPLARVLQANSQLNERGVQADEELCIPGAAGSRAGGEAGQPLPTQVVPMYNCDSILGYPRGRTLRCVVMLPFALELGSSDGQGSPVSQEMPEGVRSVKYDARFLDFYKGALLAVEQYRQSGYRIALTVLDTRNSPDRVRRLLTTDTLANADLIIGPVYPQSVALVSQYAASRRITMVSPLSGATPSFEKNPYLFQANPSSRTQLRQLANSIELSDTTNVVLVREDASREEGAGQALHLMLEGRIASMPSATGVRYSVVDCSPSDASATISRQIQSRLLPDRRNLVIVSSNSEPMVTALLGQLAGAMRVGKYRVDVYGMSQWLKMDKLDFSHLLMLNTHIASAYYVDYNDARVCGFVSRYRDAYLGEPTQFAFQGYDIMVYFFRAIFKFGMDFRYCLDKVEHWQLQNNFQFRQSQAFGSYESEGMFMLRFDKDMGLIRAW